MVLDLEFGAKGIEDRGRNIWQNRVCGFMEDPGKAFSQQNPCFKSSASSAALVLGVNDFLSWLCRLLFQKRTFHLKRDHSKGNYIFQPSFFRGHVSVPGVSQRAYKVVFCSLSLAFGYFG